MTPKEKALNLVDNYLGTIIFNISESIDASIIPAAKQCALICVENEYNSLREYLFNLRSCRVIDNHKVYLVRLETLIEEEKEVKQEINKL